MRGLTALARFRRLLACTALAVLPVAATAADWLRPGDYRFELRHGGAGRSYLLHVPPQAVAGPLPLLLSLHGGGGNAAQHRHMTGMDAAADRDGYVALYPDGSGRFADRLLTWNAGNCCGISQQRAIDDVGFIAAVLDDVAGRVAIDARRVYVAGHSNGGMMAHRLAEALPGRIAAIVSVAGAHLPAAPQDPDGRVVPVLQIHSVDDPRALYAGGLGPPFPFTNSRVLHPPVEAMLAAWARHAGCGAEPVEQARRAQGGHTARYLVYPGCREGAAVALWKLTGAGHGWPGSAARFERLLGPPTEVLDANTEIWKFVARFSLPG